MVLAILLPDTFPDAICDGDAVRIWGWGYWKWRFISFLCHWVRRCDRWRVCVRFGFWAERRWCRKRGGGGSWEDSWCTPLLLKDPEKRKHGNVWHPRPPLTHSSSSALTRSQLTTPFPFKGKRRARRGRPTLLRLLLFSASGGLPNLLVALDVRKLSNLFLFPAHTTEKVTIDSGTSWGEPWNGPMNMQAPWQGCPVR